MNMQPLSMSRPIRTRSRDGRPGGRAPGALTRSEERLLRALGQGAGARAHPFEEGRVIVSARTGGVSLGGASHPLAALEALLARDLAARDLAAPENGVAAITPQGRAFLRRLDAGEDGFAAQHREIAEAELEEGGGRRRVRVNNEESPLAWLASRKGADGRPLIDAACFEAGERLRRDMTLAGIMPGVTLNWDRLGASGGGGGAREHGGATETCIAARQRVARACAHLGEEDADLLIDLCGFLKKIPVIERERGWPARSAKIMIARALRRLAMHYGLSPEASGRARSRGIGVWRADAAGA